MAAKKKAAKKRPGPEPARLRIKGEWKQAIKKAMKKRKPREGWPKAPNRLGGRTSTDG